MRKANIIIIFLAPNNNNILSGDCINEPSLPPWLVVFWIFPPKNEENTFNLGFKKEKKKTKHAQSGNLKIVSGNARSLSVVRE